MQVIYNVDDLRAYSKKVSEQCTSMIDAIKSLNTLTESFKEHWSGEAQSAYLGYYISAIASTSTYVAELAVIAENLNTAADYYEAHEAKYEAMYTLF